MEIDPDTATEVAIPRLAEGLQDKNLWGREYLADALGDFGPAAKAAAIIRALQQQGKRTFIPLWSGRVGNSKYLNSGLVYEKEQDRLRCPQGKYLTPNPALYENYKR